MSELRVKGKPKIKTKPVETVASWSERDRRTQVFCCKCCLKQSSNDCSSSSRGAEDVMTTNAPEGNPMVSIDLASGTKITPPAADEKQQRPEVSGQHEPAGSVSNVSQVKRNFSTLLSYNKLRDFYLGTLIYSVMNLSSAMFHLALFARDSSRRSPSSSFSAPSNETDGAEAWIPSEQEWRPVTHLLASKLAECLYGRLEVSAVAASSHKLIGSLSLLTILLAITAAVTTLKFRTAAAVVETGTERGQVAPATATNTASTRQAPKSATKEKAGQALHTLGLLLILLLLYLPLVSLNLGSSLAGEERPTTVTRTTRTRPTRPESEQLGADWGSAQTTISSGSRQLTGGERLSSGGGSRQQQSGADVSWLSRRCSLPDLAEKISTSSNDSDYDGEGHARASQTSGEEIRRELDSEPTQLEAPEGVATPAEELPPPDTPTRGNVASGRRFHAVGLEEPTRNNDNVGNNASQMDSFDYSSHLFQCFYSPIGALLALAYLQPHLLEGSRLNGRLIYALTMLPVLVFAFARLILLSAARSYLQLLQSASRSAAELAEAQLTRPNSQFAAAALNKRGRLLPGRPGTLAAEAAGPFFSAHRATLAGPPVSAVLSASAGSVGPLELELQLSANLALILLLGLPLALAFGSLKRREFVRSLTGRTFAGATQLIETKVRLEHQRQQQETLLLSVLPAYVAEQVKRNMLKKTTTPLGSWPALPSASSFGQANHHNQQPHSHSSYLSQQQQHHHLHHQAANATEQHSAASLPPPPMSAATSAGSRGANLVGQQGQDRPTNHDQIGQQQRRQQSRASSETTRQIQRRSFQLASRVALGLASGAALIGGTLASRRLRSNSATAAKVTGCYSVHEHHNHQKPSPLVVTVASSGSSSSANHQHHVATPTHHLPASNATAAGPVQQQHALPNQATSTTTTMLSSTNIAGSASTGQARRGFNELYIRTYNNVSLLYGDIVGFTRLCTQLSSSQLVRVLNDLFSHFDYLAEKHKIMRIKILGDCYYGVSGIPEFAVMGAKSRATRNDNHAINCVNMGLDMIHYIRCLNVERATSSANSGTNSDSGSSNNNTDYVHQQLQQAASSAPAESCWAPSCTDHSGGARMGVAGRTSAPPTFSLQAAQSSRPLATGEQPPTGGGAGATASGGNFSPLPAFELNMRIGIHTGHIHSGVIGLKKWQFDVWSNDVSIAMHCESSGMAGRIQVTEATIQHLNGAFSYEQAHGAQRDSFLANKDIRTYFIKDRVHQKSLGLLEPTSSGAPMSAAGGQLLSSSTSSLSGDTTTRASPTTTRPANRAARGVLKFVDASSSRSNNLSDEDNIRAATIGTIRQTLLAGDSFGGQSFNSHGAGGGGGSRGGGGLAFNYQDLNPITLSYRDPQMGKLYARRKADNLMLELLTLLLLLGLLSPLLNYWLLADSGSNFAPIFWLAVIFVNLTLLLAQFWPLESDPNLSEQTTTATRQVKSNSISAVPTIYPDSNQQQSQSTSAPCSFEESATMLATSTQQTQQPHQAIRDRQQANLDEIGKKTNKKQTMLTISCLLKPFDRLRASMANFCSRLRSKWPIVNIDSRRTRLRSAMTILVFLTVIFVQCCAVYRQLCTSNLASQTDNNKEPITAIGEGQFNNIVNEHYQLNVILLLISVDLSTNLLGYKTKSAIILSLMAVHVLSAWLPCLISVSSICSADFPSGLSSPSQSLSPSSPPAALIPLLSSPQQQQKSPPPSYFCRLNEPPRIKDSILSWSNAILLVAAFWSLTFARRLEYTNRVNFLWRNRLNVDHEELEYISGINKVLLENILPSHVVQHYLTHPVPAEQQRTTSQGGRGGNQPNQQQQRLNHRAGGGRAASELQNYMRMSFSNMRSHNNELYHEQHDSVAVMFASIPHFYEFYDESDISKQGLGCIALLNEIICDFDKLLLKNKFSRIEKIKTIGSTYMAAAGLRPSNLGGRNSAVSQMSATNPLPSSSGGPAHRQQDQSASKAGSRAASQPNELFVSSGMASFAGQSSLTIAHDSTNVATTSDSAIGGGHNDRRQMLSQQKLNLICMVQFATSLMSALNGINKQSFQVFKLRVGVNTGSVIAGIIGAQRPFYDIWGDCVNIASRMESLGQVGRIQVEEKTAKLLMESLCADTYSIVKRGPIDVKGKGGMVTYFVDKKANLVGAESERQHQDFDRRRASGDEQWKQAKRAQEQEQPPNQEQQSSANVVREGEPAR